MLSEDTGDLTLIDIKLPTTPTTKQWVFRVAELKRAKVNRVGG